MGEVEVLLLMTSFLRKGTRYDLIWWQSVPLLASLCVRACERACVRACVRACACVCVCVCVCE